MKQHISTEQLNELSDKGKERLRKWWEPNDCDLVAVTMHSTSPAPRPDNGIITTIHSVYTLKPIISVEDIRKLHLPILSIGQMIEFLKNDRSLLAIYAPEYNIVPKKYAKEDNPNLHHWQVEKNVSESWYCDDLADALWEAVKEVLNKDE